MTPISRSSERLLANFRKACKSTAYTETDLDATEELLRVRLAALETFYEAHKGAHSSRVENAIKTLERDMP